MDSPAEYDIDRELEAWLTKESEAPGVDREGMRQEELEVWKRWRQNPNQQDFSWLYNRHQGIIHDAGRKYLGSTTLPKAAVKSDMLRQYVKSLETFDPSKASLPTHINWNMQHTGRYLIRYQNIGKIPEQRATMIGLYQNRQAALRESLGREPSNAELADDMKSSMAEVGDLSKEMQRITPRTVETLRREVRRDLMADLPGAEQHTSSSRLADQLIFMHNSLTPEQQVVLEHTPIGDVKNGLTVFGKPATEDPMQLSPLIGMSPQKIRALRKQIADRVKRYY